jgi:hypothetical protein
MPSKIRARGAIARTGRAPHDVDEGAPDVTPELGVSAAFAMSLRAIWSRSWVSE